MSERYVAIHRVFTGKYQSRGYILDRETGKIVRSCPHLHPAGRKSSSAVRAQKCAEKMLRIFLESGEPDDAPGSPQ